MNAFKNYTFKIISLVEKVSSYLLGKGYGTCSIASEVRYIYSFLNVEPKIAIDIGGNIGKYSAELFKRSSNLSIFIFEPSSHNIKILKSKFDNFKNIEIIPCALGDEVGSGTLYSDIPGSGLSSLTKRDLSHLKIKFNNSEDVNVIRFDEYWINELNRSYIDIVKIDVEGHELSVLKGFGEAIGFVGILQFEFGGCNIDTRTYFRDIWTFLNKYNFRIFRVTPIGLQRIDFYQEIDENFTTTNFIAVNTTSCANEIY